LEIADMSGLKIETRNTQNAPKGVGPCSQAVAFSHYMNVSAQLPIDLKTGKISGTNVKDQAKQCLNNIKAVLEGCNHVMDDIVKITIFVKNISDIRAVDEVYETFFTNYLPARTTVGVSALPQDALVQIEAVTSNGESTPA
jgi:reactive intermediate/imine deaminase